MSLLIFIVLCVVLAVAAAFMLAPSGDGTLSAGAAAANAAELESIGARVQIRSSMFLQTRLRSVESDRDLASIRDGPSWDRLLSGLEISSGARPELRIDGQGALIFRMGGVDSETCTAVNSMSRSDRRGCYQEGERRYYFVVLNRLSERLSTGPSDSFDATEDR